MTFLDTLRSLDAKASPVPIELAILDTPLADIGAYIDKCVRAGPGSAFYFASGKHPDGGGADVCHFGNGPTSLVNGQLLVLLRNSAPRLAALVKAATRLRDSATWGDSVEPSADGYPRRKIEAHEDLLTALDTALRALDTEPT